MKLVRLFTSLSGPTGASVLVAALCGVALTSPAVYAAPTACSQEQLLGTWELASARYLDKKGTVVASIQGGSTLSRKVLAGRHVAFITWQPNGNFDVAASGSFAIEQGMYVERIDSASKPSLLGKTYRFACQLQGDVWLHSGDEDGIHIEEQWRRVTN